MAEPEDVSPSQLPGERDGPTSRPSLGGTVDKLLPGVNQAAFDPMAILAGQIGQQQSPEDKINMMLGSLFMGAPYGQIDSETGQSLGAMQEMEGLGSRRTYEHNPDETKAGSFSESTLASVAMQLDTMNEAQISYLQRRLFQAGYYTSSIYGNAAQISWGMKDDATIDALATAIRVAGINRVDNFDTFLENERVRFGKDGLAADGKDVSALIGGAREVNVTLADPDSIRIMAEQSARTLLGREPTEQELSQITAALHAEQRAQAKAAAGQQEAASGLNLDLTGRLLSGKQVVPQDWDPNASEVNGLSPEQVDVATTVVRVGQQMGLSDEYIIGALSAGIVESGLKNVNYGDRDSLGVFQQRPSQGWGTAAQVTDVQYAARKFYEAMLNHGGETLGEWVANTQRPAKQYRGRYAEVMNDAAKIYGMIREGGKGITMNVPGSHGPGGRPVRNPDKGMGASRYLPQKPKEHRWSFDGEDVDIEEPDQPIARDPIADDEPLWWDSLLGKSNRETMFNEIYSVDPAASIEMQLREMDPTAYETKRVASQAYEFFSMLRGIGQT